MTVGILDGADQPPLASSTTSAFDAPDAACAAELRRWTQREMPLLVTAGRLNVSARVGPRHEASHAPFSNVRAGEWGASLRDALRGSGTLWFFGDSLTALHFWGRRMCKPRSSPARAWPHPPNAHG